MVLQPKILVVTSSFGNGHKQVSKALKSEFEQYNFNDVTIIDIYEEAYPKINIFAKSIHMQLFQHAQTIYKWFFYGTEKLFDSVFFDRLLELSGKSIKSILQNEKPDIIITTFPVGSVAKWKKYSTHPCKLYTVVTDYYIHRSWIHDEIDRYYIATEELIDQMVKLGVSKSKIFVSGIPLREEFRDVVSIKKDNKCISRTSHQILIVAGALGILKDVVKMAKQLIQHTNLNLIVVCGNNQILYKKLIKLKELNEGRLQVFGYVNNIRSLYNNSDLLITKPGGITLSESIACSLPTILYKPTPGQEKENSRIFENAGASVTVKSVQELIDYIQQFLSKPNYLEQMKSSLTSLNKGFSSQLIVNDIFGSSFINKKERVT
ncbi:MGDG synthase family glycosyltransferase [Gottfriedia luciferensis]|uniref:MGDG synthase family glycosyltransferase n=1 Tax=Gottfriedia luciferensis TaxID=178774 RepID=UPI000B453AA4|nr:glycosyltransferase [Gottfriedia luciferensis]